MRSKTERDRIGEILGDMDEPMDRAELAHLLDRLAAYTVPDPPAEAAAAVVDRLRPLVPGRRRERFRKQGLSEWPLLTVVGYMAAQAGLFRPVWWAVTALAVMLGLLLSPALAKEGISFAVVAPPIVIAGVAYGFRSARSGALEIELSCPVHPVQMVIARMLVVVGWVISLGAGASAAAHLAGLELNLWLTLSGWAAAVLLFAGVTLFFTLWTGPRLATAAALVVWIGLVLYRRQMADWLPAGLSLWGMSNGLAAALGAALVGVCASQGEKLRGLAGRRR